MFVGNKERAKRDGEKRCFVFPGSLLSGDDAKKIEQAWDKTLAAAASAFWGRRAGMPAVTRWCSTGWRGPRGGKASDVPRAASVGLRHAETSRVREQSQWADRRATRRREPWDGASRRRRRPADGSPQVDEQSVQRGDGRRETAWFRAMVVRKKEEGEVCGYISGLTGAKRTQ